MANGKFAGGTGTELDPYLIEDAHDLNAIRNKGNTKFYKLINGIDLDVEPYRTFGFPAIDMQNLTLEGDGYSIYNFYATGTSPSFITRSGGGYSNPKIRNLGFFASDKNDKDVAIIGRMSSNSQVSIKSCILGQGVVPLGTAGGAGSWTPVEDIKFIGHRRTRCLPNLIESEARYCFSNGTEGLGTNGISSVSTRYTSCFFDKDAYGKSFTAKTGITALTTEQAKTAQTFINANWHTRTIEVNGKTIPIWILKDGEYPKLWFELSPYYYLLKQNNKILTIESDALVETILQEPLTSADFEELGFNNLDLLLNKDLSNMVLLINPSAETVVSTINVKAIPKPQLIIPAGDIILKMLDKIYNFTIYSNKNSSGDIKIIFSVDEGANWLTYNVGTGEFEKIDITKIKEVKEKGIDPDTFNSINEKWNQVILNNKIRFAYYLEVGNINDISELDKLEIEMDIHGRWKKTRHGQNYHYKYDNEHLYVSFFKDGSYKINYQR